MIQSSDKKIKLINDFLSSHQIKIGDTVYVKNCLLSPYSKNLNNTSLCVVIEIEGETIFVTEYGYTKTSQPKPINIKDVILNTYNIGADPFDTDSNILRNTNFTLDSIIFNLGLHNNQKTSQQFYSKTNNKLIKEICWNPVIIGQDSKPYFYQRDFVWSLENKQLLIESIYNGIPIGSVVIRKRSFKEIEYLDKLGVTEIGFNDIVDGKQRLNAISEFINNVFPDRFGNYYNDLSNKAQHSFGKNQLLAYHEIDENTEDKKIIKQFLKMNFGGVPQSKEHLDYVQTLLNI